jgi:hypothetical protein
MHVRGAVTLAAGTGSISGSRSRMLAVAIAVLFFIMPNAAWTQSLILPTDCATIIDELKMRPPAKGDRTRAAELWNNYQIYCAGSGSLTSDDIAAVTKVMHPEMYK